MAAPIDLHSYREQIVERLEISLRRQLGEFCQYLEDPEVVEISLNPDNKIWIDRLGDPLRCVGEMKPEAAETFIGTVANTVRRVINYDHSSLQCRLPIGGHRFQAMCPPTTLAWVFSIRRHASAVFPLQQYEDDGIISDIQHQAIVAALKAERNIFITGGTGSGKTTFVNSLLAHEYVVNSRIIICEDTPELLWTGANVVAMCTSEKVTMRDLVIGAMRLRPDRLVIGETREGGPMLEALKAMGTGHRGGITTLHANSALHAVSIRIEMLLQEVSATPLRTLIAETVDVIIHFEGISDFPYRKVTEIKTVRGYQNGEYDLQNLA